MSGQETRIYKFWNSEKGATGEPFELCQRHADAQRIPDHCVLLPGAPGRGACDDCRDEELEEDERLRDRENQPE